MRILCAEMLVANGGRNGVTLYRAPSYDITAAVITITVKESSQNDMRMAICCLQEYMATNRPTVLNETQRTTAVIDGVTAEPCHVFVIHAKGITCQSLHQELRARMPPDLLDAGEYSIWY